MTTSEEAARNAASVPLLEDARGYLKVRKQIRSTERLAPTKDAIKRALKLADKGVQYDDGFTYSVPASVIVEYNDTIRRLAALLAERPAPTPDDREALAQVLHNAVEDIEPVSLSIRRGRYYAQADVLIAAGWHND